MFVEHPSSESMVSARCMTVPFLHFSIYSAVRRKTSPEILEVSDCLQSEVADVKLS